MTLDDMKRFIAPLQRCVMLAIGRGTLGPVKRGTMWNAFSNTAFPPCRCPARMWWWCVSAVIATTR